jgi:predicted DNA-binding transcriptional regulator AlpA
MIKIEELIHLETKRIAEKFKKEYLDCKDLMQITGLGRDNVRSMMAKKDFPKINVGRRRIVSVLAFVTWQTTNEFRSIYGEENK